MLPIGIAVRMLQPWNDQEGLVLQTLHPHFLPFGANDFWIRRARRIGQHGGSPTHVFIEQRATLIMNVVFVTIIG